MSGLKAATINTRGKKPCAYFQKGICAFGDKCQQDHSTSTPRRPRKDFQYIVGAEIQTDAASDGTIESIKSGIEAANDHPFNAVDSELPEVTSPPAASDRLATCVFFRRGNCKTEGCTFAHVAQEAKASDDVPNELPSSSPDGYEVNTNRKVVCRYYSTGTCKNGANCRFFHENTLESSSLVMSSPFPSVSASEDPATFDESSSKKAMDSRDFHSTNSERQDGEDVSTEASAPVNEGLNDGFSSLRSKGDFGKFTVERNGVSSYRHASIVPHLTHEEPEEKTFAHVSYPYVGSVIPHWSQYADPYADDTVPFCKLHAQGICNSSEKCHFRHTLTPKEYTTLFHDLQPNLWTLHPRNPRSPQSTKSYQIHAPTQDGEQAHPPKGLGPCKFFPSGMCRNGVDCPYEHVEPTSIPHLEHATITSRYQEQQESQTAPICKLFRRGWCIHGENCPFRHESPEDQQQEESHYYRNTSKGSWNRWEEDGKQSNGSYNNGTRMCRYFLQGNCNRGPQCLYSHDDVDHALQSERRTDDKKLESLSSESDPPMNSEWLRSEGDDQGWGQSADDWGAWKTPEGDTDTKLQKSGHQTNDKAVALNDQDIKDDAVQDYVDNSDSWSKPWSTESFEPSQPRRSQKPCKYYGQGYCAKHDCMYMHINPSGTIVNASSFQDDSVIGIPSWRGADDEETNEELMLASPNEVPDVPKPIVEVVTQRTIFGCKVCFKHDTSMENVVTVTDSRIICLSNLPLDVTPSDIETLVMPSGQCQNTMSVEEDDNSCTIQVEFPREDQAANAVLLLNEQLYDSRLISARLSTYPSIEKMSPLENCFIKLSWLTPSITVWVLYDTITKAKAEATRLDGLIFSESMIHATFIKPERKQNHSYSVKLEGLPVHVEKQSIKELCSEATSVVMDGPTCKEPVSPLIRDFLAQFGLLQFDEIPLSKDVCSTNPRRKIAFATFDRLDAATSALEQLSETKHPFLGNQIIVCESVYYFKYSIPSRIFSVLRSRVEELRETLNANKQVRLRYHPDTAGSMQVLVYCAIKYRNSLIQIIKTVHPLLRGSILRVENIPLWDDYLDTLSSEKALERINGDAQGSFFINCDRRIPAVCIYGDLQNAEETLLRMLKKVHSLQHDIRIRPESLHQLLHGQYRKMQDELGRNKVFLDVLTSRLVVRGDETIVRKARACIDEIEVDSERCALTDGDSVCPICLREANIPIKLSCKHAYCKACLQYLLCTVGHPMYPYPTCIAQDSNEEGFETPRCDAYIPYSAIHDVLPSDDEQSVLRALFISNVRTIFRDILFFCPTSGCETVHRVHEPGFVLTCISCGLHICCSCRSNSHNGITCDENLGITSVS